MKIVPPKLESLPRDYAAPPPSEMVRPRGPPENVNEVAAKADDSDTLDYDRLMGREPSESIIKLNLANLPPVPEPVQEAPPPEKLTSLDYIRAVLEPLVSQEEKLRLRGILLSVPCLVGKSIYKS